MINKLQTLALVIKQTFTYPMSQLYRCRCKHNKEPSFLIGADEEEEKQCQCEMPEEHFGIWPFKIKKLKEQINNAIHNNKHRIIVNKQKLKLVRIVGYVESIKTNATAHFNHKIILINDGTDCIEVIVDSEPDNDDIYTPNNNNNNNNKEKKKFKQNDLYIIVARLQYIEDINEIILRANKAAMIKTTNKDEIKYHNLEIQFAKEWYSSTESQKKQFFNRYK